jgi:predicted glycogen debranching enzyme
MDAKIADWVVTPRYGKPVEIQALWYNALRTMHSLATAFHDVANKKSYASLASQADSSFNAEFWNTEEDCLFDVVGPDAPDVSVRPNQIFAVSLYYSMLDQEQAARVVRKVEAELLTPYGLRTLAPSDPRYIRHYGGDAYTRDSAYHQGTVWAWLFGPFIEAYLRVHDHRFAGAWLNLGWVKSPRFVMGILRTPRAAASPKHGALPSYSAPLRVCGQSPRNNRWRSPGSMRR